MALGSGDTTVLLPGPSMVDLVRAAHGLIDAGLGRFVVVGGIAVTARLGRVHRATADVDAVVDTSEPPEPIRALLALPDAVPDANSEHRVYVAGTKVEIQPIHPISDEDLDGLDGKQHGTSTNYWSHIRPPRSQTPSATPHHSCERW